VVAISSREREKRERRETAGINNMEIESE